MTEEFTGPNDVKKEYRRELANGNALIIYLDDPTPFWKIRYEKGLTPGPLSGMFTGRLLAERAVDLYIKKTKTEEAPKEIKTTIKE